MSRKYLLVPIVLLAVAAAAWFRLGRHAPATEAVFSSGTVEATEARLGFQVTGRLEAVFYREGDWVEVDTALARLDQVEIEARRDQAVALVAAARALLIELERGFRSEEIAEARAARDGVRLRLVDAERDLERTTQLFEGGSVSREALDKATVSLELSDSQLTQAEERLGLLVAGPRPERVAAQRAQVKQAEAAVKTVDAIRANMTITAPFSGLLTLRHREPGEIISPGTPVLTLIDLENRWVRIYVPEDRIGAISLGDRAEIRSDTYPEKRYAGEVVFIASEAEFTPKTIQTQEERVRLVYAVKLRIIEDPHYELKPGMPVDANLALRGMKSESGAHASAQLGEE